MTKKKSRTKSDITKVKPSGGGFLAGVEDDKSLDSMAEFMIVPRLKIIHGQTRAELKDRFGEGSVVITPGDALVCEENDAGFEFVPHFFFTEWCKWSDLKDKENNSIMERSFDPTCDIAKRAQNPETRDEVYEGDAKKPVKQQRFWRYVQHFCWAGVIYGDHPLAGTPVVLSMERGEFSNGRSFITAIQMRRVDVEAEDGTKDRKRVPLWAQRWQLKVGTRQGEAGSWFGFDYESVGIIDDDDAENFRAEHIELARLHEENKLRVDHGEDKDSGEVTPSEEVGENDEY